MNVLCELRLKSPAQDPVNQNPSSKGLIKQVHISEGLCDNKCTQHKQHKGYDCSAYEQKRTKLFTYLMLIYELIHLSWGNRKDSTSHFFWKSLNIFFFRGIFLQRM